MANFMISDSLPYDQWIEDALRGVVHQALLHTSRHGLPGNHHFYVTFRTSAAGVRLAPVLRAEYPDEMTIVLQHQFWDLEVDDEAFEVSLNFRGKPQRLHVPLAALTAFGDPSVNFGMHLKTVGADMSEGEETVEATDLDGAAETAETLEPKPPAPEGGEVVAFDKFRKK
jgi:hypothetical protein